MAARISLTLDPPHPMPGSGPCRADKLFDLGGFCGDRASTWHSLCATGQLHAHLVRQRPHRRSP